MAKIDTLLDELIESQVETLVQDDAYYQNFATPLKSASQVKREHRKQLLDFFKLTEIRKELENAPILIEKLLPDVISPADFKKVKGELDRSSEHFINFIGSMTKETTEKPLLFQEMLGLSDETLIHVYELGVDLVKKGKYTEANTLFVFLTALAPHVPSYWIAEGACLQALNRHEEAIAVYSAAKFLNSADPAPLVYSIESYYLLKDHEKAYQELEALKEIVKHLSGSEKAKWEQKIKEMPAF